MIIYTGLSVIGTQYHITTSYAKIKNKTPKICLGETQHQIVKIKSVEYWEHVDKTVAVVDCPLAVERYEYFKSIGLGFDDYDTYIPHITLTDGNFVDEYKYMELATYKVGKEYLKIK